MAEKRGGGKDKKTSISFRPHNRTRPSYPPPLLSPWPSFEHIFKLNSFSPLSPAFSPPIQAGEGKEKHWLFCPDRHISSCATLMMEGGNFATTTPAVLTSETRRRPRFPSTRRDEKNEDFYCFRQPNCQKSFIKHRTLKAASQALPFSN